jgi:hypothetical protein
MLGIELESQGSQGGFVSRKRQTPHRMQYLRRNWYSLTLIISVAWIANYLHFTSFGLYEDDWYFIGFPFIVDLKTWMGHSLWQSLSLPEHSQGRPLQFIFGYTFAALGALTKSLAGSYLIAFSLFSVAALLMYQVLRQRFSRLVSTLAAIIFVVTPLHTLRQFLNGQYYSFGPAFILVFIAMLLYLRGRRSWAYAVAPLVLLTYESMFFLFIGVPLLRRGCLRKNRRRAWMIHLGFCAAVVVLYFLARKILVSEIRVNSLPGGPGLA